MTKCILAHNEHATRDNIKRVVKNNCQYAFKYNILIIKLQSARQDFLCGRVLLCALVLRPYGWVELAEPYANLHLAPDR